MSEASACAPEIHDLPGVEVGRPRPDPPPAGQPEAETLAYIEARRRLGGDAMVLAWHDRETGREAPEGVSERQAGSTAPGWLDHRLHHGARLLVGLDGGRFMFRFR